MTNAPIQLGVSVSVKPVNKPTDQIQLKAGNAIVTVSAHDAVRILLAPVLGSSAPVAAVPTSAAGIPPIGEYWAGHGGEYVGLGRMADGKQYSLILGPEASEKLSHADALKYVQGLEVDGHKDFVLMGRRSGALCYANLPERFKKEWYWLGEQFEADVAFAWVQDFSDGYQYYDHKGHEFWVRAVRSELIQ